MEKYKTIENKFGKIDLYLCETKDGKYIIGIPEHMKDNAEMFVDTYNAGGKETTTYDENVEDALSKEGNPIEKMYRDFITDFPMVVPIVPCLKDLPDFQQLSKESVEEFGIHEKIKECIIDAKDKIQEITGKSVQDKIFLSGYSASGVLAQRFCLIYPELVSRALIGGAAGTIPVPSKKLKYPIGIEDYKEIFGKEFNDEEYKKIQFAYYVAEKEAEEPGNFDIKGDRIKTKGQIAAPMHDMSFRTPTTPKEVGKAQREVLGKSLEERYFMTIELLKKVGIDIEGIVVKGATHKDIFNGMVNPNTRHLKDQIIAFYNKGERFYPDGEGMCKFIDMSFQKKREEDDRLK